jgi:hypothetical protein
MNVNSIRILIAAVAVSIAAVATLTVLHPRVNQPDRTNPPSPAPRVAARSEPLGTTQQMPDARDARPPASTHLTVIQATATPASAGREEQPPDDPDAAAAWARAHPEAAVRWMTGAPPGASRDAVAEVACEQIAEADPAAAVSLAERFGSRCPGLRENLVQQWADRDTAAAAAYAMSQPPGPDRDQLLGRVAFSRARNDPAAAASLVAEQIEPGPIRDDAVVSVIHQWMLRDAPAAVAWVRSFPPGALRTRALQELEVMLRPPR